MVPAAIIENERAGGRLQLLEADLNVSPLTFRAGWLASPDVVAVERVGDLARQIAQSSLAVDAAAVARH